MDYVSRGAFAVPGYLLLVIWSLASEARGNAREVNQWIRRDAGIDVWVKPLVVFVGDWRVKNVWRDTDVRVITAPEIGRYFAKQDQPQLKRREIELICSHLKRSASAA